ncbi:MAG: tRNA1(Val) (adenine(37)-N6)-methyltransferase [Flavisolibacter sp.]
MFQFKQFTIHQHRTAMKVTTDSCLFGAWTATELKNKKSASQHSLDIGTGTGLLSLMIAQESDYKIDALEIDPLAAQQARENIEASPWKEKINIIEQDLLTYSPDKQYDVIFSNPPFYENELSSGKTAKDIAHHSKALTLEQLFLKTKELLKDEGQFYFLLPYKRQEEINQLLSKAELVTVDEIHVKPSVNHAPSRIMIRGMKRESLQNHINKVSPHLILSIKDQDQQYTTEFRSLLNPYYLYL